MGSRTWSPQVDEVLRDCIAVLRARDEVRGGPSNWLAIGQVFRHLPEPSATCRQRIEHLEANNPGEKAYMHALQAEWMRVWKTCSGTTDLPEKDPCEPVEFNLREHVLFLRKTIDKEEV